MLHGAGMGRCTWKGLEPWWPSAWEVDAPTLPGHRGEPSPDPRSLEGLSAWLADRVDETGPRVVAGWSMGAFLLQWTLSHRGELGIEAAVLVNGAPRHGPSPTTREVMEKRLDAHFADPARPMEATLAEMARNGWSEEAVEELRAGATEADETLLRQVRWDMWEHDFGAAAPSFPVPVLMLHGASDRINPVSQAEWAEGAFPRATLRCLKGRHAPFASDPEGFVAAMAEGLMALEVSWGW